MTKRRYTDRDILVDKHSASPEYVDDQGTGRVAGEELRRVRARRPTSRRLEILEEKDDARAADIAEIKVAVADIRGDQKAQNVALHSIQRSLERQAARADVEHAADVSVEAEQRKDAIDARKARRDAILKIALFVITGGVGMKLLQWWLG